MINDAGKHEVKKVLRDRCNGAGLVPLAGVPLATFANPRSMFWRACRIPRDTGDLHDSSAVWIRIAETRSRLNRTSRPNRLFRDRGCRGSLIAPPSPPRGPPGSG